MKALNEKHDAIIYYTEYVKGSTPKEGELMEHFKSVKLITFFKSTSNRDKSYIKIELTKDFIIDLYNQIRDIEKETIVKAWEQ